MPNTQRAVSPTASDGRPSVRFEGGFNAKSAARELVAAIWDGIRLRCPACSKGPIWAAKSRMNPACPECGAAFERTSEGDFVGAIVTAYAFISGFAILFLLLLNQYTQMDIMVQIALSGGLSLGLLLVFYRNMRGVWVALLVALTKWLG